jgi:hypothetical protein
VNDVNPIYIDKATPELFAALAKAQGEVENASKSSNNPHFKSKYADLAEVLNTVRPVFAKHGLSIVQSTAFNGAFVSVTTLVAHSSGGLIYSTASAVPSKTDAQGIGSTTTYLRRYSLAAMSGVAQEDDDGNAAAHNGKPSPIKPEGQPTSGAWEAVDSATQAGLLKLAASIAEFIETGDATGAWELIERQALNTDEKAALWTRLDSKTRTALKKAHEQRKAA